MKRFPTCYEQKSAENDQKVLSAKKNKINKDATHYK